MIANRSPVRHSRRTGIALIEMTLTSFLLVAAMVATIQVVGWVALDRRAVERRERAVREASNLMDRVAARSWDEITPEALGAIRLGEASAAYLPGSSLAMTVTTHIAAPTHKKIIVEIRWNDRSGRPEAPVRLVSWSYRREEPVR